MNPGVCNRETGPRRDPGREESAAVLLGETTGYFARSEWVRRRESEARPGPIRGHGTSAAYVADSGLKGGPGCHASTTIPV